MDYWRIGESKHTVMGEYCNTTTITTATCSTTYIKTYKKHISLLFLTQNAASLSKKHLYTNIYPNNALCKMLSVSFFSSSYSSSLVWCECVRDLLKWTVSGKSTGRFDMALILSPSRASPFYLFFLCVFLEMFKSTGS